MVNEFDYCISCIYVHTDCGCFPCNDCTYGDGFNNHYCEEENSLKEDTETNKEKQDYDVVSNPKHYCGAVSIECIDAMRVTYGDLAVGNFCICNAFKYMWRYKNKNGNEDLNKAKWYLNYVDDIIHNESHIVGEFKELEVSFNRTLSLYNRIINK